MLDTLTLKSTVNAPGPSGSPVPTITSIDVYAEPKGVKRAEFYAAQANGKRIDAIFEINADEYSGQTDAVYSGKDYTITRTYPLNLNRIELVCTRR